MTMEELKTAMRENQECMQNKFIDALYEQISYLCEKANSKDYEQTEHEREMFGKIVNIVVSMNNWF